MRGHEGDAEDDVSGHEGDHEDDNEEEEPPRPSHLPAEEPAPSHLVAQESPGIESVMLLGIGTNPTHN